jgi:cell division cycle 14
LYYNSDEGLLYEQFFADYGPLNLGYLHRYVTEVDLLLQEAKATAKKVVHYSSAHLQRRSNAAFLVCCFALIKLKKSVAEAYRPFMNISPPLLPFRDAAFAVCTYSLSVLDCVKGVAKAIALGHFDFDSFDREAFFHLDRIENGDISWIIPGKFIAFSGPLARKREIEPGVFTMAADE